MDAHPDHHDQQGEYHSIFQHTPIAILISEYQVSRHTCSSDHKKFQYTVHKAPYRPSAKVISPPKRIMRSGGKPTKLSRCSKASSSEWCTVIQSLLSSKATFVPNRPQCHFLAIHQNKITYHLKKKVSGKELIVLSHCTKHSLAHIFECSCARWRTLFLTENISNGTIPALVITVSGFQRTTRHHFMLMQTKICEKVITNRCRPLFILISFRCTNVIHAHRPFNIFYRKTSLWQPPFQTIRLFTPML